MANFGLTELYSPGTAISAITSTAVTQGQFVALTTSVGEYPTVMVAPPGGRIFGLTNTDAPANTLLGIQRGNARCFRVPTTQTIAAGANIEVGANGEPITATSGVVVAQALHSSQDGFVDLTLV